MRVLTEHWQAEVKQCHQRKIAFTPDRLIFCTPDGSPLIPHTVSQGWRRLCQGLGYPVHFHSARHTHASILLKNGVSAKVVQERLGHRQITTTLGIYAHVMPGMGRDAAAAFGKLIGGDYHRDYQRGRNVPRQRPGNWQLASKVVRLEGFEPTTPGFEDRCSIH